MDSKWAKNSRAEFSSCETVSCSTVESTVAPVEGGAVVRMILQSRGCMHRSPGSSGG